MRPFVRTAIVIAINASVVTAASAADYAGSARQVAQAAETPRDETPAPPPPEAAATVLDEQDIMPVLGARVRSSAGEDMGRVINVVVDRSGQARAAVIDFGGFLGVGNRKVAVDWNALHFSTAANKDDRISLDLTRDQLKAAPEYKDGRPLVVLGTAEGVPSPAPAD
jgi:hypothetical protein